MNSGPGAPIWSRILVACRAGLRHLEPAPGAISLEVPAAAAARIVPLLASVPGVAAIEPLAPLRPSECPDDPLFARQRAQLTRIDLPAGWSVSRGSPRVRVAVVDTGVSVRHDASPTRWWPGCMPLTAPGRCATVWGMAPPSPGSSPQRPTTGAAAVLGYRPAGTPVRLRVHAVTKHGPGRPAEAAPVTVPLVR